MTLETLIFLGLIEALVVGAVSAVIVYECLSSNKETKRLKLVRKLHHAMRVEKRLTTPSSGNSA